MKLTRLLFLFALLMVMGTSVGAEGTDVIDQSPSYVVDGTSTIEADVMIINLVAPLGVRQGAQRVASHNGVMLSFDVIAIATLVAEDDYGWRDNVNVSTNELSFRQRFTEQHKPEPRYRVTPYKA